MSSSCTCILTQPLPPCWGQIKKVKRAWIALTFESILGCNQGSSCENLPVLSDVYWDLSSDSPSSPGSFYPAFHYKLQPRVMDMRLCVYSCAGPFSTCQWPMWIVIKLSLTVHSLSKPGRLINWGHVQMILRGAHAMNGQGHCLINEWTRCYSFTTVSFGVYRTPSVLKRFLWFCLPFAPCTAKPYTKCSLMILSLIANLKGHHFVPFL